MTRAVPFALAAALAISAAAHAGGAPDGRRAASYSLERLDAAANFLKVQVDRQAKHPAKRDCSIGASEAKRLILPLHALIDEQVARRRSKPAPSRAEFERMAASCAESCRCGIYDTVFGEAHAQGADPVIARAIRSMRDQASKQSPSESARCAAETRRWFCSSALLQQLKKEAPAQE